ncbi:hypothetical protein ERO13_D09G122000v2 [Gossypium hirsutum]|uniref:Exo-poly-alpha-D-galacturonosidase n=1 Tax=Gossypium hirsutum TaxID=3635 RepID=A0ABM3AP76_GOSHI|nr:exo-poly-alpha-D-galacturonosidase-like [Gossypium hirsutum]KAG4130097.1 hypothetical protein ERO13_D09G122000v2 [Gossypium hirsutum]
MGGGAAAAPIPRLTAIAFLFLLPIVIQSHTPSISVRDFGATGDGKHYDTAAIQSAIGSCRTKPCYVTFPTGTYLTATIFLKSNVILDIPKGSTILGGTKLEDYPKEFDRWYVILAENARDVGITGGGVVDGQGLEFVVKFDERKNVMVSWNQTGACSGDECRPRLVGFLDSTNVRVWNVTFRQPAYWCLHIVRCENTSIHDVSIYGDFNTPNNDGIDIEDSNNTVITRCHIDTGDDAICPKTYTSPLYNLTATNSWIRTKSSAIKLGSASWFELNNLVFDNITIVDSHRGLALQIRDGGNVSDITFSNINISTRYYDPSWWGRAEPIYVTTCPRHSNSSEGSISNLNFVNISAVSENGIFLSGSKGGLLRNLRFININLTYKRWTKYMGGLVDYRPGCQGLVNHSTAGIIMEHIDGLDVENVNMRWFDGRTVQWDNPLDFRPSTVNNISLLNFHSGVYKQGRGSSEQIPLFGSN